MCPDCKCCCAAKIIYLTDDGNFAVDEDDIEAAQNKSYEILLKRNVKEPETTYDKNDPNGTLCEVVGRVKQGLQPPGVPRVYVMSDLMNIRWKKLPNNKKPERREMIWPAGNEKEYRKSLLTVITMAETMEGVRLGHPEMPAPSKFQVAVYWHNKPNKQVEALVKYLVKHNLKPSMKIGYLMCVGCDGRPSLCWRHRELMQEQEEKRLWNFYVMHDKSVVCEDGEWFFHDDWILIERAAAAMEVPENKMKMNKMEKDLSKDEENQNLQEMIKKSCLTCVAMGDSIYGEEEACKRHMNMIKKARSHKELAEPVMSEVEIGPVLKPGLLTYSELLMANRNLLYTAQGLRKNVSPAKDMEAEKEKFSRMWEARKGAKYSSSDSEQEQFDVTDRSDIIPSPPRLDPLPSPRYERESKAAAREMFDTKMEEGGYTFWGSWMGPPQEKLSDIGGEYNVEETMEDKERRLHHLYDSLEIDPTSKFKQHRVSGVCQTFSAGQPKFAIPCQSSTGGGFAGLKPGFLKPRTLFSEEEPKKKDDTIVVKPTEQKDETEKEVGTRPKLSTKKPKAKQWRRVEVDRDPNVRPIDNLLHDDEYARLRKQLDDVVADYDENDILGNE